MGRKSLNRVFFLQIPIIKQDTNFISLPFGQTNLPPPPLQSACTKPVCRDFQVIMLEFHYSENSITSEFCYTAISVTSE